MDVDGPRILDVSGRDALIDALGVDAVVLARIDVDLAGTTVMGVGNRYPKARVSFNVYTKGQEKSVWFEGKVDGEEAKESVGKTAFIDTALMQKLALESAQTAFAKIGTTSVE